MNDDDLDFLQHCSEEQLANITRLLTHNEKGKARLSSVLNHNRTPFGNLMEGHPGQHRRNWQLIAGRLQHYGGDSIANKLRGHGKLYRAILLDVSKRLKLKTDKEMSTFEIEQYLLETLFACLAKNGCGTQADSTQALMQKSLNWKNFCHY